MSTRGRARACRELGPVERPIIFTPTEVDLAFDGAVLGRPGPRKTAESSSIGGLPTNGYIFVDGTDSA